MIDWLTVVATGEGLVVFLLLGIVAETIGVIVGNREFTLGRFGEGEGNVDVEVEKYASKALTFASITFAGVTFLLAQFQEQLAQIRGPMLLFVFGFALFLLSYKLEVFSGTHRLAWSLQQRLFNYGILALVSGLLLFFSDTFSDFLLPVGGMAVIIVGLHVVEYLDDLCHYISGENPITDDARLCRFFK